MPNGGRDFLRLMNDQSRRAADFDRRMRWTLMRRDLTEATGIEADLLGDDGSVVDVADVPDVVDITTTEELAEPLLPD